jgi:hypothetical protein
MSDFISLFQAVNAAFVSARDRVGLPPVRGKFETSDVGNLGMVLHLLIKSIQFNGKKVKK